LVGQEAGDTTRPVLREDRVQPDRSFAPTCLKPGESRRRSVITTRPDYGRVPLSLGVSEVLAVVCVLTVPRIGAGG
jgi:hypothetical protein